MIQVRVHAAALYDLKIGSVWKDGNRIKESTNFEKFFQIDTREARLITLEQAVKLNNGWVNTVVPESMFCMGENRDFLKASWYVIVPVQNAQQAEWLVIPATELLCFYMGVSKRLLSATLKGGLDDYLSWDKSYLEHGQPVLHVKKELSQTEQYVLARAIVSPVAKTALFEPHQHFSLTRAKNAVLNSEATLQNGIKANFPFKGITNLEVKGKKSMLQSTNNSRAERVIFVMEILKCTHPIGFSKIIQNEDELTSGEKDTKEKGKIFSFPQYAPLFESEDDEYELEDLPADERLERLVVRNYFNRFSGLDAITHIRRQSNTDIFVSQAGTKINIPVNALTEEEGNYTKEAKGNLGVDRVVSQLDQVDRDISLFLEMLECLRVKTKERGWTISTRKSKDGLSEKGELIACFPGNVGKRRTWHKIKELSGKIRPRQVVWAEVRTAEEGPVFYLLEMELKPGESSGQCTLLLYVNEYRWLDENIFDAFLLLTAVQNRWPDAHNTWKKSFHKKIAEQIFMEIKIHRVDHPRIRKGHGIDKIVPTQNPDLWSEMLLKTIDEKLDFK